MFKDISIEELLTLKQNKELVLIDVRSPSEYRDATIPGSLNIPLFNDEERAEIGTLYKQVGVQAAKERGLEIVSAKLPAFIKMFSRIEEQKAVFCWRGGMRSKTTATVLSLMGIRVFRLTGGVRAYRNWVLERLQTCELPAKVYVINGKTGSGKTTVLQILQNKGYPVLDLEAMAGHRGSIFGEIGLQAHNQKTFESLLIERSDDLKDAPYVLFEGESNRIGKAVLPQFIAKKKETGEQIFIEMPLEERVRHIVEEYRPWEHKQECLSAFSKIHRRLHTPIAAEIDEHLRSDRFESAVRLLLEHYYDPRYEHSLSQYETNPTVKMKVNDVSEAAIKIQAYIDELNN